MKFFFNFLICFFILNLTHAQKLYYNIQNYQKNAEYLYQDVLSTQDVSPGKSGRNVVWNFSDLKPDGDSIQTKILAPDSLAQEEFSNIDFIEKKVDDSFKAYYQGQGRTFLVGYYSGDSIKIEYTKPLLLSRRPFSYGDKIFKDFSTRSEIGKFSFPGEGKVEITADGHGTLILPGVVYDDVLRLKIVRHQTNFVEKYNTTREAKTTTYVWFDQKHQGPLLKISEVESKRKSHKKVKYLLKEKAKRGIIYY